MRRTLALVAAAITCASCSEPQAAPEPAAASTTARIRKPAIPAAPGIAPVEAAGPRMEGEVHLGGRPVPIRAFVGHQPQFDLRGQCLAGRDDIIDKGGDPGPLCFDERERAAAALDTLRIEFAPGLRLGKAMQLLRGGNQGAHFLVEATGSLYQILDLQSAARRGELWPAGEVRVLSGSKEGQARLAASLVERFPALRVQEVDLNAELVRLLGASPAAPP